MATIKVTVKGKKLKRTVRSARMYGFSLPFDISKEFVLLMSVRTIPRVLFGVGQHVSVNV